MLLLGSPACSLVSDFSNIESGATTSASGTAAASGGSGPGWLSTTDRFRKRLTLHTTASDSDLVDFPVAVLLSDADLVSVATADGRDIAFSAADGVTQLEHEIEQFDRGNGSLTAWVRLPYVQVGASTDVYIYFGDSTAGDRQNLAGLWPTSLYRGVWHLSQDPKSAMRPLLDSTAHANHGLSEQGASTQGIVGGAVAFNNDARVHIGHSPDFDFGPNGSFSLSAWVNLKEYTPGDSVLSKKVPSGGPGWIMPLNPESWGCTLDDSDDSTQTVNRGSSPEAGQYLGKWVHLAAVVDRSSKFIAFYARGKFQGQTALGNLGSVDNTAELLFSPGGSPISGAIDEVRIYGAPLSPGWIALEHQNMSLGTAFVTAGALEQAP